MKRPDCIVVRMEFSHFKLLLEKLVGNRKYPSIARILAVVLFAVTLAGGFVLFRRAVDDTRPPVATVVNVPTQVNLLFSYDKASDVVNHIVFFSDVHLEAGPSDSLYYAGGAAGHRVLVVSEGRKPLSNNAQVDIKGTVRMLPSATTLKNKWKLSKEEVEAAQREGVYIEADEIIARRATPAPVARKQSLLSERGTKQEGSPAAALHP
jgi:hypothetical protein